MIVKGAARGQPSQLAGYLLKAAKNEKAVVLENSYGIDTSLQDALWDMNELGTMTAGSKFLYHAQIRARESEPMTAEQWLEAANILEKELGFPEGQPRVLVEHHTKNKGTHCHVVFARTDVNQGILVSNSHNYQAHERASLEMEIRFGHEFTPGVHAKKNPNRNRANPLPKQAFSYEEWQVAQRRNQDPRERKATVTRLFEASDTGAGFRHALEEEGFILARGIQTDYLIIDKAGDHHGLPRQLPKEIKAKHVRDKLKDIDLGALPDIEHAKTQMDTHQRLVYAKERKDLEGQWRATASQKPEKRDQRDQATQERKTRMQALRDEFERFERDAKANVKGFRAALAQERQVKKHAVSRETEEIRAMQDARGWMSSTLARWLGTIKREQERIEALHRDYLDLVEGHYSRINDFKQHQTEAYQQRRTDLKRQRLEDERSIQGAFKQPAQPDKPKEPPSPDSPTHDHDGPEHER